MSDEKVLSKEIAEQFLTDNGSVDLSEFTEIEHTAAESLSKYQGSLFLDGLTQLSDAAAESLNNFQGGYLGLGGLTVLSDAAILCCIANEEYDLPNVTDITPKQIRLFGNGFNSEMFKLGITKITKEQALAFSEFWWMELYLDEVTELDDETAEILADVKADLSIGGVRTLSPRAARAIASRWRDRGEPFSSVDTADLTIEHWKQMYYGAKQGLENFKEVLNWPSDYDESYWGPNE